MTGRSGAGISCAIAAQFSGSRCEFPPRYTYLPGQVVRIRLGERGEPAACLDDRRERHLAGHAQAELPGVSQPAGGKEELGAPPPVLGGACWGRNRGAKTDGLTTG